MASPNHLVVVCGHGIWCGGPARGHDEAEWLIESYKAGETPTFIAHIKAGLQVAADDPRAVVAFSGGPTRKETPLSEGRSYANLAAANDYFGLLLPPPLNEDDDEGDDDDDADDVPAARADRRLHPRILVEEQALDSYYNLLFSLLAFWRAHGVWPARLTIVSHAFKRARLVAGHCGPDALAFLPLERVGFVGINPPNLPPEFAEPAATETAAPAAATTTADTAAAAKQHAMQDAHTVGDHWAADPHGVGPVLAGKRRARNPWAADQRLFASAAERQRSGLVTRPVGGGDAADGMEALAADSPRPWNHG
ncbi:DUF218 domain containing protein [Niveomyces insectorum RCEF 264]|uniref:DUF218 domain containing protein n=1 Tax=Niveomyces insectorum RCEF 264 TaxID=1081102 RepID=A0A167S1B5_9HYPO|nr:DUF218 domain containing protein [Niveomyces insectorum RCEF 264]